jgi:hypothetical protein
MPVTRASKVGSLRNTLQSPINQKNHDFRNEMPLTRNGSQANIMLTTHRSTLKGTRGERPACDSVRSVHVSAIPFGIDE